MGRGGQGRRNCCPGEDCAPVAAPVVPSSRAVDPVCPWTCPSPGHEGYVGPGSQLHENTTGYHSLQNGGSQL